MLYSVSGERSSNWIVRNLKYPLLSLVVNKLTKQLKLGDTMSSLVHVKSWNLFCAKPLPEPIMTYCQSDQQEQASVKFESKYSSFLSSNCNWKCCKRIVSHFVRASMSKIKQNQLTYRKISSISRTISQNLNVSCILLQLSSLNPLKPGVKLRMKM